LTDIQIIAKRLALIETLVADLRRHARPETLADDVLQERFVEHTLQLAIQAALDVSSHIVSEERLGEPRTNQELFDLMARGSWLERPLATSLRKAAGFRNVLVHGYLEVDLTVVRRILDEDLDDLLAFVAAVRAKLGLGA
jgi:uncharacterized protein YutE (UPF0331/DUF86 family)